LEALSITALEVRTFRNLASVSLKPSLRFNVIHGQNGQGKSNLLEAIYCVLSSSSFRTKSLEHLRQTGAPSGSSPRVLARSLEAGFERQQVFALRDGQSTRILQIDGKRPKSLVDYATRTPVVVFHPGELSLSMGSSAERRKLLDRVGLFLKPGLYAELAAYGRALKSRQKVLEVSGENARSLSEWETLMVTHGLRVMEARAAVSLALCNAATDVLAKLFPLSSSMQYAPSAPEDESAYAAALQKSRLRDRVRRSASVGPHKDDLSISLNESSARTTASQGQHRGIVLALKAAEMHVIGTARGARPILLLDDVSSELDRERTLSLFAFLQSTAGQIFLTTTRPDLIETAGFERVDFEVSNGSVTS
jgi:DNA replication and repair protein RecF